MVYYTCTSCCFSSKLKSNYIRHLNTSKHKYNERKIPPNIENNICMKIEYTQKNENEPKMNQNEPKRTKMNQNEPKSIHSHHKCKFCNKEFKTAPSKRRHELHRCKKNVEKLKLEKQILNKEIDKLLKKTINNTHITTQNNQQNIKLNNYGSEDLSHISDFFKTNLLSQPHGMIPKMIEAVHFNENKPENKNIVLPNKNDNKLKIFSGDKWVYKNKNETVDDLIDGKYFIMDAHYETICNNNENNMNLYKRFQKLFDERNTLLLESQKKECELVFLNNR